jgi:hypothetical protein
LRDSLRNLRPLRARRLVHDDDRCDVIDVVEIQQRLSDVE